MKMERLIGFSSSPLSLYCFLTDISLEKSEICPPAGRAVVLAGELTLRRAAAHLLYF